MLNSLLLSLAAFFSSAPGDPDLLIRNEFVEVGVSKDFGGAITWLSLPGQGRNLVNNADKGRQVQQSVYAGVEIDRQAEGQRKNWSPWPWNPVQAGDTYGNKSRVIEARVEGGQIYTKVQPMLWDMKNELAEAYYETWINLEGPAVHVLNKVTCFRTDNRWTETLRDQEFPAAYTIASLPNLFTYPGDEPWTSAPLEQRPHVFPSQRIYTKEKWAAYVDDAGFGVGVYNPDIDWIIYMFSGEPKGETADAATGYIAPVKQMMLKKDSTFFYEYYLVVGKLEDIRQFVYVKEGHAAPESLKPLPPPPGNVDPVRKGGKAGAAVGGALAALAAAGGVAAWRRR